MPLECIWTFTPWSTAHGYFNSWNFPRGNQPNNSLLEKCPRDSSRPYEVPLGQLLLNIFSLKNYHPGQLPPIKFPPWQLPPQPIPNPHYIFPWIIPRRILTPDNCPPWNSSRSRWQQNLVLDNYPWKIYRSGSRKARFTHSSLEIFNKFRKKFSKGLCMPLCENILLCANIFYKWMDRWFIWI